MTLADGSPPMSDYDRNLLAQIQTLLQTNNDLIIAIHKSFSESSNDINRKIDGLQDQVLELKRMVLETTHQGVFEEATKWRSFMESTMAKIADQHHRESLMLSDLLKLSISLPKNQIESVPVSASQDISTAAPSGDTKEYKIFQKPSSVTTTPEKTGKDDENGEDDPGKFVPTNASLVSVDPTIATKPQQTNISGSGFASFSFSKPNTQSIFCNSQTTSEKDTFLFKPSTKPSTFGGTKENKIFQKPNSATTTPEKTGKDDENGEDGPEKFVPTNASLVSVDPATVTKPQQTNVFGSGFGSFSFSKPNTQSIFCNSQTTPEKDSFLTKPSTTAPFGGTKEYKIFQKPNSVTTTPEKTGKDGENGEDDPEKFVPTDTFEPVISLPSLVEVKTGEEDEQVMFVSRCKLFRYDPATKENKERGVGEIKLLCNSQSNRYRCVMRRDQVHKICANFPVHKHFKIAQRPNVPTVYNWHCTDYSDDPVGVEVTLHAKFKDKDIAKEFANKINEAVDKMT